MSTVDVSMWLHWPLRVLPSTEPLVMLCHPSREVYACAVLRAINAKAKLVFDTYCPRMTIHVFTAEEWDRLATEASFYDDGTLHWRRS